MVKQKDLKKRNTYLFGTLTAILIVSIMFYVFSRTFFVAWQTGVPISGPLFWLIASPAIQTVIGIMLASMVIACVTLNFQTITNSKILTPAMLGFDAMFVTTQVILVFIFGTAHFLFINDVLNFIVSVLVMIVVSFLMFGTILGKNKNNLVILLLFGLVVSTLLRSLSNWLMAGMNTPDFNHVQSRIMVTVERMNLDMIPFVAPFMILIVVIMLLRHRTYDVLSLGESNAKNLGVNQEKEFKINLILIAIGMAFATALIGPLSFLGLLVVNISRQIFKTYKHKTLFVASSLIAMIAMIFGQGMVEIFSRSIPVSVFVDLIGCTYMFYLIIKENKR